jgi:hypothetical protein
MDDLSILLDNLSSAINDALYNSSDVLHALAAVEEMVGDFRISIDMLLPDGTVARGGEN